jgi:hypothetical protein
MDSLAWLQNWYIQQCNGDWEHQNGVSIETLDNPGWMLKIQVVNTPLDHKPFEALRIDRTKTDWVDCSVKPWIKSWDEHVFQAAGGPLNLEEMIQIFRNWAES